MIVLLPGMDGTGTLFEPLLACLPPVCDVQIIGYPAERHLTYEQLEAYVLERLPTGRSFLLMAESFSGPLALRLTERIGPDLRAVILVCSFASRPLGWWGLLLSRLPLGLMLRLPLPDLILRYFLLGRTASDALVRRTREVISAVNQEVLVARLRQALTVDYGARAILCSTPVIALYATNDRLLGRRACQSISKMCPRATVQAISAPHFALQSVPADVVRTLAGLGILADEACS
ncbi:MAG: alpha/beta hydrolase [Acidobacteriaceae bacterium]|nr:alpha/beta hydrolase [Acidobacteriaceae bacterium]MBV9304572.1 alpha/beta hydrolase [Acidobacteriaceae bacterium]